MHGVALKAMLKLDRISREQGGIDSLRKMWIIAHDEVKIII